MLASDLTPLPTSNCRVEISALAGFRASRNSTPSVPAGRHGLAGYTQQGMNALHILFKTSRFNLSKVGEHFVNPCWFGEDLAAWLRGKLIELKIEGSQPSFLRFALDPCKWPVLHGYGERILLPDGLRVKLTDSFWTNARENGDDTGDSVFCNGSRFSRRGAVANARTMHVLGRNQHCF